MILIIGLICFVASCIGTISGFGISTIMTPMLLLFLPYQETLFIVGGIHWLNSIWKIVLFRKSISWRLVFIFGIPAIVSSIFGALLVVVSGVTILMPILGVFLIAYSLFLFFKPTFYVPATDNALMFGGSIVGFSAGIFGIRGAIRSMFLMAFNLPKELYLGTTGAISVMVDTARLFTYWSQGIKVQSSLYWAIIVFIVLSFVGAYVGRIIVTTIPQEKFRFIVTLFLLLMGIHLLLF